MVIPEAAVEAAKEAMREVTPPPGVSKVDWLAEHGEFALIAGAIAAAAPHILAPLLTLLDAAEARGGSMYCKVTTYEARKALGQDVSDWKPSEPWPSGLRDRLATWAKESGRPTP